MRIMGWVSCFMALQDRNVKTAKELKRIDPYAYKKADRANVPRDRKRAWMLAEKHLKMKENERKIGEE